MKGARCMPSLTLFKRVSSLCASFSRWLSIFSLKPTGRDCRASASASSSRISARLASTKASLVSSLTVDGFSSRSSSTCSSPLVSFLSTFLWSILCNLHRALQCETWLKPSVWRMPRNEQQCDVGAHCLNRSDSLHVSSFASQLDASANISLLISFIISFFH